jgi:glutamine amidotransferase
LTKEFLADMNNDETHLIKAMVVDYDMGNLSSIIRACFVAGLNPLISSKATDIESSDLVIIPGVGAFGDAMEHLRKFDLIGPVKDFIDSGRLFVGICLGMQLLMEWSEEFGRHEGLGVVNGGVVKFKSKDANDNRIKVPRVGWNQVRLAPCHAGNPLLDGVGEAQYMYFSHSYRALLESEHNLLLVAQDCDDMFPAAIIKDNVYGFQFHPEISGEAGLRIYQNILKQAKSIKYNK